MSIQPETSFVSIQPETSLSLLRNLADGANSVAWERFLTLYGPLLVRWNKACGLQQVDAEDVAQEIAIAVYRGIHRFKHRHAGSFRAWLRGIARNKILHLRKRNARRHEKFSQALDPTVACRGRDWGDGYAEEIFSRGLNLIKAEFSPSTWTAFLRVYLGGEDPATVGLENGISRNAVYMACGRVRGRLKEVLEGFLEEEAF